MSVPARPAVAICCVYVCLSMPIDTFTELFLISFKEVGPCESTSGYLGLLSVYVGLLR
jgi:hypothetical protein